MEFDQRKQKVIEQLSDLTDESLLSVVESVLDSHTSKEGKGWENLSQEEREGIDEGLAQLNRGEGISHSIVMEEIRGKFRNEQ